MRSIRLLVATALFGALFVIVPAATAGTGTVPCEASALFARDASGNVDGGSADYSADQTAGDTGLPFVDVDNQPATYTNGTFAGELPLQAAACRRITYKVEIREGDEQGQLLAAQGREGSPNVDGKSIAFEDVNVCYSDSTPGTCDSPGVVHATVLTFYGDRELDRASTTLDADSAGGNTWR